MFSLKSKGFPHLQGAGSCNGRVLAVQAATPACCPSSLSSRKSQLRLKITYVGIGQAATSRCVWMWAGGLVFQMCDLHRVSAVHRIRVSLCCLKTLAVSFGVWLKATHKKY